MNAGHPFRLVLSVLSLALVAYAQDFAPRNLLGEYEMGHRFSLEGSPSERSWFASSLVINSDGTYRGGSECFPTHGTYVFLKGVLTLKAATKGTPHCFVSIPVTPEEQERLKNPPPPQDETLTVVEWSGRVYLIHEDGWQDFVSSINSGLLPHTNREASLYLGPFYRKLGDEDKPVTGLPDIPARWKQMILERPVVAEITQVRKVNEHKYLVTINKGHRDGISKDMPLYPLGLSEVLFGRGFVEAIRENEADVSLFGEVKIGDTLSTRLRRTGK